MVHVYGNQRGGYVNKLEILSRSIVNICFENSIGEGYTTEKLMHSRIMGCKSLYWGDLGYKNDFSQHDTLNTYEHFEIDRIPQLVRITINQSEGSEHISTSAG